MSGPGAAPSAFAAIAPPAHEDVVKAYNELRSRVVLAQELRNILQGTQ